VLEERGHFKIPCIKKIVIPDDQVIILRPRQWQQLVQIYMGIKTLQVT
jgi:hypothetical protein